MYPYLFALTAIVVLLVGIYMWKRAPSCSSSNACESCSSCPATVGCPYLVQSIRNQFDPLYDVDPNTIISGSEVETQIGQFCDIAFAYQATCPNPDPVISAMYSSLCTSSSGIPMQARRFAKEDDGKEQKEKKIVEKPNANKCFIKPAWTPCVCAVGTQKGSSTRQLKYTSKTGTECPVTSAIQSKMDQQRSCGDQTRSCRCGTVPLPPVPEPAPIPEPVPEPIQEPIPEPVQEPEPVPIL